MKGVCYISRQSGRPCFSCTLHSLCIVYYIIHQRFPLEICRYCICSFIAVQNQHFSVRRKALPVATLGLFSIHIIIVVTIIKCYQICAPQQIDLIEPDTQKRTCCRKHKIGQYLSTAYKLCKITALLLKIAPQILHFQQPLSFLIEKDTRRLSKILSNTLEAKICYLLSKKKCGSIILANNIV